LQNDLTRWRTGWEDVFAELRKHVVWRDGRLSVAEYKRREKARKEMGALKEVGNDKLELEQGAGARTALTLKPKRRPITRSIGGKAGSEGVLSAQSLGGKCGEGVVIRFAGAIDTDAHTMPIYTVQYSCPK
jgi:hypothetical protein